jgi:hypothetical protein
MRHGVEKDARKVPNYFRERAQVWDEVGVESDLCHASWCLMPRADVC